MNKFVKPAALLGLAAAVTVGALASQAEARSNRAAATNSNASNYYGDGYAYGTGPTFVAPGYPYGQNSYAYAPGYYSGAPVRPNDTFTTMQRHLDGTE